MIQHVRTVALLNFVLIGSIGNLAYAGEVKLVARPHDPYGWPRPGNGHEHVPLGTSFFFELGLDKAEPGDNVLADSISVELRREGAQVLSMLQARQQFAPGFTGKIWPRHSQAGPTMLVYIEPNRPLDPKTKYTVSVSARSRNGLELPRDKVRWQFTTEAARAKHNLTFDLSLRDPAVRWRGGFFTGFCGTSFTTNFKNRIPTFELMDELRRTAPRAWSLQRDFWLTGMDDRPSLLPQNLPNIVRERETRRIKAIDRQDNGVRLSVEDFFGHKQYGIGSGRPLADDYHPGDLVLIADGEHDARAKVVSVNDADRSVLVAELAEPAGGWKLTYAARLPILEDNDSPGLFPLGGCYLRKFSPAGTPMYFWKRLDKEWDLAVRRFNRRVVVNFADAPGDLSIDGRNWTTAKDYAELHEVVRTISDHVIERYGDASLDFVWSVFNEPDLGVLFWRTDWNELQKFYDYTVDGILRAFEDRGYDSNRVKVGGLELGGIFGTNLKLREFLAHCSPRAQASGATEENAAFADRRLDGKRSKRLESLCRDHDGRGSPCDFVSIHAYNRSKMMADKLARAKEMALELDAEYFAGLAIHSHESCPGWDMPPDPAFGDSYLGNGYYETWCADVARRQLARAADDPRYAAGESILTFWPGPCTNFEGRNDCARQIHVDDNSDGKEDRAVTIAMPILHFLGLVASMGDEFRVLPEQTVGGHVVSGFASQSDDATRILIYDHHEFDSQGRSEATFDITLNLTGIRGERVEVTQYRFDKDHNSYFQLARSLRDRADLAAVPTAEAAETIDRIMRTLETGSPAEQRDALDELGQIGRPAASAIGALVEFSQKTGHDDLRQLAQATVFRLHKPAAFPAADVLRVQELSKLHSTSVETHRATAGKVRLSLPLSANGANFVVIQ
jgi:hypothetical protein